MKILWRYLYQGRVVSDRFTVDRIGAIWRLSVKATGETLCEHTSSRVCKDFANEYEQMRLEWRGTNE